MSAPMCLQGMNCQLRHCRHITAELNAAWAAEVKRAAGLRSFRRSQARQQEQVSRVLCTSFRGAASFA